MRAFHGDADLKRQLVDRLDADFAAGLIEGGQTGWSGGRGSVAGSLARNGDLRITEDRIGIPEDVLTVLDHLTGHLHFDQVPRAETARRFLAACAVGAELGAVVPKLIGRLGMDPDENPEGDTESPVAAAIDRWLEVEAREEVRRSGWTEAQEAAAQSALLDLWNDMRADRRTSRWPDYPAAFRARHPELAAGYEAALVRTNASYARNAVRIVDWFLELVAAADR